MCLPSLHAIMLTLITISHSFLLSKLYLAYCLAHSLCDGPGYEPILSGMTVV